jgi:hypothetical protein
MASWLDDDYFKGGRLEDDSEPVKPSVWLTFRKVFIDMEEGLSDLLTDILCLRQKEARLYIDLEGDNLCRYGTIGVLQILSPNTTRPISWTSTPSATRRSRSRSTRLDPAKRRH